MKARHLLIPFAFGLGLIVALLWALGDVSAPAIAAPRAGGRVKAPNAPTAELHVCPSGCAYSSVQDAVDDANDGDVIKVATGVYTGVQGRVAPAGYEGPNVITQVVYISKTVTIRGGYTTAFTDPPDPEANPTTLDAQDQGRVLFIGGNISPTVEGLRITGGDATGLGGGPWKGGAGGGVYVITATASIRNNQVFSNTADFGGGLYLWSSPTMFSSNTVTANDASIGGGLYLWCSDAMLSGNTITSNTVNNLGGGLYLRYSDATFSGNTVTFNTAPYGGGLFLSYSPATLSSNTVTSNTAHWYGGGLDLSYSPATLSGNTVTSNTAWRGGGLHLFFSDATLTNNVVADNQVNIEGSGLYINGSSPRLLHTTVACNIGGDGSGVYVTGEPEAYSTVALTNTILVSHSVGITVTAGNTATLHYTLWGSGVWANETDWGDTGAITHTNDVTGPPVFVDPDAGDYHIVEGSAAIDAGVDAGVTVDIDGDPRLGIPDIGADEYVLHVYLPLVLRSH